MTGTIEPPCGVPSHRMGRWEDVVLGIWWCPDCGEEIWVTEGVDGGGWSEDHGEGLGAPRPAASAVPGLPGDPEDAGDDAGAPGDRAPGDGFGWRDRPGGQHLWRLIWEAFGRAAS